MLHLHNYGDGVFHEGVFYSSGAAGDFRKILATPASGGVSIVVDAATGRIYIAASGASTPLGNDDRLVVVSSDDGGATWNRTDIDPGVTRNPSMAIDSAGNPAIAYIRNGVELRVARLVEGLWHDTLLAAMPAGDGGVKPQLAFDADDRPHVLFYDRGTRNIMLANGAPTTVSRTLTVSTAGSGTGQVVSSPGGIACGADCEESYAPGSYVLLEATPNAGSAFGGWAGACIGTGACLLRGAPAPVEQNERALLEQILQSQLNLP